ncbi:MAG: hypothetical protein SFW67_33000 [Myxococcaceae bacterium]|nr:hypothetical protein [Myxococcaceae bacterium]
MVLMGAALLLACARAPLPPPAPPVTGERPRELWVDGSASPGGDGTVERPFKTMPALDQGAHLHLRSGLYAGPFRFPQGTVVTGHGVAVLFVEGRGAVVSHAGGALRLERVLLQGGSVGLETTEGAVWLDEVKFSGHGSTFVDGANTSLVGTRLELTSNIPGTTGFRVREGRLQLRDARLTGPMRHGVKATGAALAFDQVQFEGPANGVLLQGGSLEGAGLRFAGGQGVALHVLDAGVTLSNVDVTGHEYAVLGAGTVAFDGLTIKGPQQSGVSLVGGTSTLKHVRVERAGGLGGLQLLGGRHVLEDIEVKNSNAWGVLVRRAEAAIGLLRVSGLRGEAAPGGRILGDGLMVRDGRAGVDTLIAEDLEGSALFVANAGAVVARSLEARRCAGGAVFIERQSEATIEQLVSRGSAGPSVTALDEARLRVRDFSATGGDVSVWADCAEGVRVDIARAAADTTIPALRCLFVPPVYERQ